MKKQYLTLIVHNLHIFNDRMKESKSKRVKNMSRIYVMLLVLQRVRKQTSVKYRTCFDKIKTVDYLKEAV